MSFANEKKVFLAKQDKSRKASIDKEIRPLVNLINSKLNYYTTSSCSGRIVLLKIPDSMLKKATSWLFVSHSIISFSQIKHALIKLPKKPVWFRQEPAILHVCSSSIEDAQDLVNKARQAGFKRSGIQATRRKIAVELIGTEFIHAIISKNNKLLINNAYLKILIEQANKKLKRTRKKIKKLIYLLST